ncbi:MAG: amidohydrolase [Rhodanobacteraceae bacterium]|nr:MAG: amidohydrolase [Rhodanobacteraceae bacterium]
MHDCTWPTPDLVTIHRDFLPGHWRLAARPLGITAAIAVQSQSSQRDTEWLLKLAEANPCIAGVVGWVDLEAGDAPERIAVLATHPKLRGIRPMLQDLPDDDWILRAELAPAIEALLAHNLCLDALVRPRHLPQLLRFAERHPDLPIVIDHAAKPDIANGTMEPWRRCMTALAELPSVFCKLSGMVTEAGDHWHTRDLLPWVDHLLGCFGPHRLLWGSDWPVLNLASDYPSWLELSVALTHLDSEDRTALFGGNAVRFYGLHCEKGIEPCA